MKKLFLPLILATIIISDTTAQESTQFGPEKGDISTEISINPFVLSENSFNLDAISLRWFITNKDALKIAVGFGITNQVYRPNENSFTNATNGNVDIYIGYERHFKVAKRIDLYAGAELGFIANFAYGKGESVNKDYKYIVEYLNITTEEGERASLGFGAAAVAGIDFYLYKGLFIGAQLGLGITTATSLPWKVTISENDYKTSKTYNDVIQVTTCQLGVSPTLRLGWTF